LKSQPTAVSITTPTISAAISGGVCKKPRQDRARERHGQGCSTDARQGHVLGENARIVQQAEDGEGEGTGTYRNRVPDQGVSRAGRGGQGLLKE
jgi:hypothetical protein